MSGVGYGPGPGAGYRVGDAFSWAWNKFTKNPVELIVPTLVFGVIYGVCEMIIQMVAGMFGTVDTASYGSSDFSASYSLGAGGVAVAVIGALLMLVVVGVIQSAYISGMLDIADGRPVTIGSFFKPRNIGSVVIAWVLSGIIAGIGLLLCIVPGVIALIMLMFSTVAVLDRNQSGTEALGTSFNLAKANFGSTALTWLLVAVVTLVGILACLVGLLVAYPLAALMTVYAWRRLNGAPVAPLTP